MKLNEEIVINSGHLKVYEIFRNLHIWQSILLDVVKVEVLYDDMKHQEFTMTVRRPNGEETIRGVRYCVANESIQLCQLNPPLGFKKMLGDWTFIDKGCCTKVIAAREFELLSSESIEAQTKSTLLRKYLSANLQYFKNYIEMKYAH